MSQDRQAWYPTVRNSARYLDSSAPALFAEHTGFTLSLEVPLPKGQAHLRGSTPCLPPDP